MKTGKFTAKLVSSVARGIKVLSEDVPVLPRTCEYVALHDRRDFADVMKVRNLEMGGVAPILSNGP
jgi:hypothetical protein